MSLYMSDVFALERITILFQVGKTSVVTIILVSIVEGNEKRRQKQQYNSPHHNGKK